jgi:hypothetical protein
LEQVSLKTFLPTKQFLDDFHILLGNIVKRATGSERFIISDNLRRFPHVAAAGFLIIAFASDSMASAYVEVSASHVAKIPDQLNVFL